ncbi:MAG: hypothetical protein RL556_76 [Actinomycetota bacterium]
MSAPAKKSRLVFWVLAVAVITAALDQLAKTAALQFLPPNKSIPVIGDLLKWRLTFNDSAAFSLGWGVTWIFTTIAAAAILVGLWFARKVASKSWAIMLGALLGGVTGNFIDRILQAPGFPSGKVVDFIEIPFNFPIFNVADMAISIVATLTVIRVLMGHSLGGNNSSSPE